MIAEITLPASPFATTIGVGIVWLLAGVALVRYSWRSQMRGIGLPLAYFGSFSLVHGGGFVYALPWYDPTTDAYLLQTGGGIEYTAAGLLVSVIGIVGLLVGVWGSDKLRQSGPPSSINRKINICGQEQILLMLGAAFFFVVHPIASRLPSGASLSIAGAYMAISGLCLVFLRAKLEHQAVKWGQFLGASVLIPVITLMAWGFLSYAAFALIVVSAFALQFWRPKRRWLWVILPMLWLAISCYVTYMAARRSIRDIVWSQSGYVERIERIAKEFRNVTLFNPMNVEDLHWIDKRLNQNDLIGAAVYHLDAGYVSFAKGETLVLAAVAWIPRAIWIGKPAIGGSGDLASRYTGRQFAVGTNIGLGPIMELYINFGSVGVFGGMVLLGAAVRFLDTRAASRLYKSDVWGFARYQIFGLSMIQTQGRVAEIVGSLAAAVVLLTFCEKSGIARLRISWGASRPDARRPVQSVPRTEVRTVPVPRLPR